MAQPPAPPRASHDAAPAFVRARLRAWAALAAALAGVWISASLGGASLAWFAAGGAGAAAAAIAPRRWWWIPAAGAVLALSAGWATARFRESPPDRLDRLAAGGDIVTVRGLVSSTPRIRERDTGPAAPGHWRADSAWFTLEVRAVETDGGIRPASGSVRVFGGVGLVERAELGRLVSATGVFLRPGRARNPGEPDWLRLANEAGRAGSLSVGGGGTVADLGPAGGLDAAWAWAVRVRTMLRDRAMAALGLDPGPGGEDDGGGVVGALVLGERDASFDGLYRVFQRAGVAHVLAVSGFHLALLCGLAAAAVRLTGERGRLETIAIVAVVVTLLVFVPARSPILRAGVLALALVAGDAMGRRWDRLAVLAWAALGLLVWKPSEAMSLGYLLSVGVTALLIAMAERDRRDRWALLERRRSRTPLRVAGRRFGAALRLNAACWAASAPLIIAFTGVFSPLAPLATVAVVPLAGVLLVLGWAQAMLGVVWPDAAGVLRPLVELAGGWTGAVAGWFDGLPGSSMLVVGLGWWWAAFATAGVLGWLFWRARRGVFAGMLGVAAAYAVSVNLVAGRVDGVRADMLDVGDGTSVLIRAGSEALLWDCGSLQRRVGDRVADSVIALGVRRVPTAVVTHPNLDHFNGLPEAAARLGVRRVLVPPEMVASDAGGWGGVRAALADMGVTIEPLARGDAFRLGPASAEVLWPPPEPDARLMANDRSLVVRFAVPGPVEPGVLLMTGDVQRAGVAGLLAAEGPVGVTVVEAPHHGSAVPEAMAFVAATRASVVMQSTGPSRLNDERWDAVRRGRWWLSTAERGAVYAWIRGDGSLSLGGASD